MPVKVQYKLTITMFILRFAKALAASSCSGGVFIPVKVQYKLTITMFILCFAKALVALSCSGGVLHLYKTKITYLPKALLRHFSRDLESPLIQHLFV